MLPRRAVLLGIVLILAGGGTAQAALVDLAPEAIESGGVVSSGVAAAGGSLVAGARRAPWTAFSRDGRVFVRAFAGGRWVTQGDGALNVSADGDAEQPAIDFAGQVPWAVWSERDGGAAQIFASRFDAGAARWEPAGGGTSLNLHPDRDAGDPALAGGSTGPWVAWREAGAHAPGTDVDQLFVARPSDGFEPVGTGRLGGDPSLNVDRTRAAGDPDIAFAGPGDSVPWVVWREHGETQTAGDGRLQDNAMIFAARAVAPAAGSQADGGMTWTVVGSDAQGALDAGPAGGPCGADALHEGLCALNVNLAADAGAPRMAAGTMTPGAATAPWVVWAEANGDVSSIFAARLVGTGADAHFELADRGHQLGSGSLPDIAFAGLTPYVSWIGVDHGVHTGHFADPVRFVADHTSASQTLRRPAITSTCTPDPSSGDGSDCPGDALGSPFVAFDDAFALRGAGYPAGAPETADATAVSRSTATVAGVVTPQGARMTARFDYGPTPAYGSRTPGVDVVATGGPRLVSEDLTDLPPGTTIHYRLVVGNDLVSAAGEDATFTTAGTPEPAAATDSPPPPAAPSPSVPATPTPAPRLTPQVTVGHDRVRVRIAVDTAADVTLRATLTANRHRTLALGTARTLFPHAGSRTLTIKLTAKARHALEHWHRPVVTVVAAAGTTTVRTVTRLP